MNEKIKELETELQEANESINWWTNRFKAVEKENQKLKKENQKLVKVIDKLEKYVHHKFRDVLEKLTELKNEVE